MAEEQKDPAAKNALTPEDKLAKLEEQNKVLSAKLDALEAVVSAPEPAAKEAVAKGKPEVKLSGESFEIKGTKYVVRYPWFMHKGTRHTEADVLANSGLQNELVDGGFGVIKKLAVMLMLMFAMSAPTFATSITLNINTAEVISTTKRDFYALGDLMVIYRTSNDAIEFQTAQTRTKVWGGDIDSVTISGITTVANKLAYLRTLMLEATTTNGYRVFLGRNDLDFNYTIASNRLDIKHSKNKQPLWFGSIDSVQIGALSGSAAKLAYLRSIYKWEGKDCIPTATAATIAAGAAAGSSPTVAVTGDAYSGTISVTTGTTATTGTLATVTLKITAPNGIRVAANPTSNGSILHVSRVKITGTTTTIVVAVPVTALSDATSYTWDYQVVPY